ncbi:MAG TPA: hypothetical protein VGZ22_21990 [Isosphaeraceae bacterium]|nr:hypothetical protein [Isosphaeraceae bacterium]
MFRALIESEAIEVTSLLLAPLGDWGDGWRSDDVVRHIPAILTVRDCGDCGQPVEVQIDPA